MGKTKKEMKQELNDAKIYLKEGIQKINEEQRIKKEERIINIEKNAQTGTVNYFHRSAWDTMSEKTLKRFNLFFRFTGVFCLTGGLLVFFAAGDKLGLIFSIPGLFFTLLDVRKFTSSYKNNKSNKK
ncbi:hypothetical protein [Romboutsia sp. 1001216sp1]|uniref:hypothetical protein n=1 Tax=Romboutsia sp. 1001216sp1 TaxID=2986997 RepID=UPI002330F255|nr:hypothetical protein [Romboutsia sp. 1001216sp1]MDB8803663.1 hypothetical protein [Romboutsia sp. 1001216sp1]MDB8807835.1 hypothetical protein [Romboutsia sp. 1001216sp1]MDB8809310.1 hypothetical protein [Romboutsia sp. 1001216sp1]MDB8815059.1 hypothetical protein [Romboutsia sp. 1001216sp1]MDB8817752.1 hypothetical protein [Romboutsia sp. 1001216sp1]